MGTSRRSSIPAVAAPSGSGSGKRRRRSTTGGAERAGGTSGTSGTSARDAGTDEHETHETRLRLNANEAVVVTGRGALVVLRGDVRVHGLVLRGRADGSVRVSLACDAAFPVCVQSLGDCDGIVGGGNVQGKGGDVDAYADVETGGSEGGSRIPYVAARYAEVVFEGVAVERVAGAFEGFFPVEWTGVAEDIRRVFCGREEEGGGGEGGAGVVVVCGSKNTGKSSFSRYLVNTLLNGSGSGSGKDEKNGGSDDDDDDDTRVLYLDMDCGQPEYTPPGVVSLFEVRADRPMLEPTYMTRYARPVASYFIGDTSPGSDPELYEESVEALLGDCDRTGAGAAGEGKEKRVGRRSVRTTVVVNTHGWVQGLGLDVLCRFLRRVVGEREREREGGNGNGGRGGRRVALVRMQADNPRHNLPDGLFFRRDDLDGRRKDGSGSGRVRDYHLPAISSGHESCVVAKAVRAAVVKGKQQAANATEKRTLQWHNFARHCVDVDVDVDVEVDADVGVDVDVARRLACQRPYRIGLDAVTLSFCEGFQPVDDEQALRILNGAVVGLCAGGRKAGAAVPVALSRRGRGVPMCFGVGIVRSVCLATRSLYVLTPLPLEVLSAHVDRLVVGRVCDLPNSLLVGSPYLAMGCIVGGGVRSSRGNLKRAGGNSHRLEPN